MPEFKRNRFNKPHRPFNGGGPRSRSQDSREMFDAECNNCRGRCQVPFRPNGKKPVYCSNCFTQNDERKTRPDFEKREFSRERHSPVQASTQDPRIDGLKRQLDTIAAMLEKLVATIESSNRSAALTKEVRKHVPAQKPAAAPKKPAKKVVAKKTATKTTRAKKV